MAFLCPKNNVRNPFAKAAIKGLHPQDIIYEHLIHNILFPNTRYNFIGISEDIDGARIILGQPLIADNYVAPKQGVIDDYLVRGLDLKKEGAYFYSNDYTHAPQLRNILTEKVHILKRLGKCIK